MYKTDDTRRYEKQIYPHPRARSHSTRKRCLSQLHSLPTPPSCRRSHHHERLWYQQDTLMLKCHRPSRYDDRRNPLPLPRSRRLSYHHTPRHLGSREYDSEACKNHQLDSSRRYALQWIYNHSRSPLRPRLLPPLPDLRGYYRHYIWSELDDEEIKNYSIMLIRVPEKWILPNYESKMVDIIFQDWYQVFLNRCFFRERILDTLGIYPNDVRRGADMGVSEEFGEQNFGEAWNNFMLKNPRFCGKMHEFNESVSPSTCVDVW